MRLKKLYIKDYKNIKDQTFDFSANTGYIALIGLNGSGKSNLLEAISLIFDDLYGIQHNEKVNGYTITYEIGGILFTYTTLDEHNNVVPLAKGDKVYPSNVIACYSGEDLRLWNMAYMPYYMRFFSAALHGKDYVPQTMYINKYCWKIALISLLFSLNRNVQQFVTDTLHIDVNNVLIKFTYNSIANPQQHDAFNWLERVKQTYGDKDIPLAELRDFGLSNLQHQELTEDKLVFYYLYFLFMPARSPRQPVDKLITNISITLGNYEFDALSEGEKKMILIGCITQVLGDENSVILLDEPDAHVHIENKRKLLEEAIIPFSGQIIFTTHSPIFIEMMNYNNLKYLEDGCGKNMDKIKAITEISNNKLNVLDGAIIASAKRLIVTEGPDDIKHIKKAIDALSRKDTRFEKLKGIPVVFQGGAKLVEEYYNSIISKDINNIEKVVFVFDFDSEGRDGAKLVEKIGNAKIDYVFYNKKYPITSTDYDFYLEDFYSASVYSDIKLPQIVNTPTYYQMKKMATLSKSIKEKLQKKIDNNQISENDFDDFANFFDELLNKFNI